MITVEFTAEEIKHISNIGEARTDMNKYNRDIADYDQRRFKLTSLQANKLGVMVEAALVKYFGYDILTVSMENWVSFYTAAEAHNYKSSPDVFHNGQWYDTRRVEKRSNPVAMRTKDRNQNVVVVQGFVDYILTDGKVKPGRKVELLGWADPAKDWEDGWKPGWAKTNDSRVIDPKPIEELFGEKVAA